MILYLKINEKYCKNVAFFIKSSRQALLGNFNMTIYIILLAFKHLRFLLMSTYPQWLLKTQKRIFIGFVDDIGLHNLDISHQYWQPHMSKILLTPSSRQNEFSVPMSNLITKSPWLEQGFLKQTIYTFELFGLCIRCPSYTRKTTTISIVQQSNVCSTSLIIQFTKQWPHRLNHCKFWHSQSTNNPSLFRCLVPIQKCVRKLNFKLRQLHNFLHAVFLQSQITAPDVTQFTFVVSNVDRNYVFF